MMLATLIQALASSSATMQYSNAPSPSPPYSPVDGDAEEAVARHLRPAATRGISPFTGSSSLATGSTSSAANRRAVACRASRSGVRYCGATTGTGGSSLSVMEQFCHTGDRSA